MIATHIKNEFINEVGNSEDQTQQFIELDQLPKQERWEALDKLSNEQFQAFHKWESNKNKTQDQQALQSRADEWTLEKLDNVNIGDKALNPDKEKGELGLLNNSIEMKALLTAMKAFSFITGVEINQDALEEYKQGLSDPQSFIENKLNAVELRANEILNENGEQSTTARLYANEQALSELNLTEFFTKEEALKFTLTRNNEASNDPIFDI